MSNKTTVEQKKFQQIAEFNTLAEAIEHVKTIKKKEGLNSNKDFRII